MIAHDTGDTDRDCDRRRLPERRQAAAGMTVIPATEAPDIGVGGCIVVTMKAL